jgi:hypothetical protein
MARAATVRTASLASVFLEKLIGRKGSQEPEGKIVRPKYDLRRIALFWPVHKKIRQFLEKYKWHRAANGRKKPRITMKGWRFHFPLFTRNQSRLRVRRDASSGAVTV